MDIEVKFVGKVVAEDSDSFLVELPYECAPRIAYRVKSNRVTKDKVWVKRTDCIIVEEEPIGGEQLVQKMSDDMRDGKSWTVKDVWKIQITVRCMRTRQSVGPYPYEEDLYLNFREYKAFISTGRLPDGRKI